MAALDEDSLICDFAEYYHILDWRGLGVRMASTLAFGLPETSRIKKAISGDAVPVNTLLLAHLADQMRVWMWWHSQDGQAGRNRPINLVDKLLGREEEDRVIGFESVKEYEERAAKIKGGG